MDSTQRDSAFRKLLSGDDPVDPVFCDLIRVLDFVVMEPDDGMQFRILGQIPNWFTGIVEKSADSGPFIILEELYHFAEGFIPLAESWWDEKRDGTLKSGPWTETDSVGNERHLELCAVSLNGRKILLLQLLGEAYQEKRNILQSCREQGLDYEILFKTQQALNKAHDLLKTQADQLKELALVDELTGLNNRRGFMTLAEQQVKIANRNKTALTLVYFDLDNFKTINDTLGHAEGDRVLVLAADLLRDTFRQSDILGRMGGDEFVALITDDDDFGQKSVRERLEENLKNFNSQSELNYELSTSIGIAVRRPEAPCSLNELLAQSDMAMFEDKTRKKLKRR